MGMAHQSLNGWLLSATGTLLVLGCGGGSSGDHPAVCGNGIVEAGEQCDDQYGLNGDGWSAACVIEPGFTCTGSPGVCR